MDARVTRPSRRRLRMLRLLSLTNRNYETYNIESCLDETDAVRAWSSRDLDRNTRLNSSHDELSRMPSSA